MPFILGITGGIGSGKSAATRLFETLGIEVIDADILARNAVSVGTPALEKIALHFGHTMLLPSGELDRKALRMRIFSCSNDKQWLEGLLHPIIRAAISHEIGTITSAYGILSSPLLFETHQDTLVNRTLVIDCDESIQRQRAMARDNMSREQLNAIMSSQLSREARNLKADDIISNNLGFSELTTAITHYHKQLLLRIKQ
jgi:dephospho-CoA kinase